MEILATPKLKILEQPIEKFRFRYKSEMMVTNNNLASASNILRNKQQVSTVELVNFCGDKAIIRCTLVTKNENRRVPHAHRLVRKENNGDNDSSYELEVTKNNNWRASFIGMGIIHTAKKHVKEELIKKMRLQRLEELRQKTASIKSLSTREESKIKMDAEQAQKWMDLNSVALCFRGYVLNDEGILDAISEPVYSNPINNLKSALTGKLKICRISRTSGSSIGGDEIYLLVEKVGKKNIQVKFFETDEEDNQIWYDYGRFTELDVHHQYAIVLQTPSYKDRGIISSRDVWIQLERPSDSDCSERIKFTYKPTDSLLLPKRIRLLDSEIETTICDTIATTPCDELISGNLSAEMKKLTDTNSEVYIGNADEFSMNEIESVLFTDVKSSTLLCSLESRAFALQILIESIYKFKKNPINTNEGIKIFDEFFGDTPLDSTLYYNQLNQLKYFLKLSQAHISSTIFSIQRIKKYRRYYSLQ